MPHQPDNEDKGWPRNVAAAVFGVDHVRSGEDFTTGTAPVAGTSPASFLGLAGRAALATGGVAHRVGPDLSDPAADATQDATEAFKTFNDAIEDRAGGADAGDSDNPIAAIGRFLNWVMNHGQIVLLGIVSLVVIGTVGRLFTINVGDQTE